MMTNAKQVWMTVAGLFLILSLAIFYLPGQKATRPILIGVPDDSSRFLFQFVIEERGVKGQISTMLEVYPIKDCCSSTSAWALSTEKLDMAVMCPDAAERLIKKDQRYSIIGPCIINSDIAVLRNKDKMERIGITQQRSYQENLARQYFGGEVQLYPMMASSLPYALDENEIDGVVMDIGNALRIPGERKSLRIDQDIVTYVLVVRKDFVRQPIFQEFISQYNRAVEDIKDEKVLQKIIEKYAGYSCNGKEADEWKKMNVQNLSLTIPAIN